MGYIRWLGNLTSQKPGIWLALFWLDFWAKTKPIKFRVFGWSDCQVILCSPSASGHIYLHNYFQMFPYFIWFYIAIFWNQLAKLSATLGTSCFLSLLFFVLFCFVFRSVRALSPSTCPPSASMWQGHATTAMVHHLFSFLSFSPTLPQHNMGWCARQATPPSTAMRDMGDSRHHAWHMWVLCHTRHMRVPRRTWHMQALHRAQHEQVPRHTQHEQASCRTQHEWASRCAQHKQAPCHTQHERASCHAWHEQAPCCTQHELVPDGVIIAGRNKVYSYKCN